MSGFVDGLHGGRSDGFFLIGNHDISVWLAVELLRIEEARFDKENVDGHE